MTEHDIQALILDALNATGACHVWRQNAGKVRTEHGTWTYLGPEGSPDITGVRHRDGRRIEIEVKVPRKKPKPNQARRGAKLLEWGCLYGVASTVEEALAILKA